MVHDIILNVNDYLHYTDEIFNRYIVLEDESTFLFAPGERYPIISKYKYKEGDQYGIRSTPYYPYKSATCFIRLLKYMLYKESILIDEHYDRNPFVKSPLNVFPDISLDPTSIILEYIPNITIPDRDNLLNIVASYISAYSGPFYVLRDHVIDFDVSGEFLIIKDLGDILAFRYKEACDVKRRV